MNLLFDTIIPSRMEERDIDFLKDIYNFYHIKVNDWKRRNKLTETRHDKITITEPFSENIFPKLQGRKVCIVGTLTQNEKISAKSNGIVCYWDLEKYQLKDIPVFRHNTAENISFLISGNDRLFNSHVSQILFSCYNNVQTSPTFSDTLDLLQRNEFDIIILDWDNDDMNLMKFIESLKKIKQLPVFISTKDFKKENLFQNLSSGIRDYSEMLFTKEEILKMLVESIPFQVKNAYKPEISDLNRIGLLGKDKKIQSIQLESAGYRSVSSSRGLFEWLIE